MTIICKKYILKQQILQTLIFLNDITKINSNLEKNVQALLSKNPTKKNYH